MKKITANAPGKCILFGEHAVVYNKPAIAMAISLYSSCTVEECDRFIIDLKNYNQSYEFRNLEEFITNFPSQFNQIRYCLINFKEKLECNIENVKITISSSLFPNAGLGSSASIAVALNSALNEYFGLNFQKEKISQLAFEMERIVHGSPSGIDNSICTFGNMIYYEAGEFQDLIIPYDLKLLITYTNIEHDTKKAIAQVRSLKEKNPKQMERYLQKISDITKEAEKELKNGNLSIIGKLMNQNQSLLTSIKVSNKTINEINNLALKVGAYGSKLTGAGLGGCVITLGNEIILNKLSTLLENRGFKSFLTNMDRGGVKIGKS